MNTALVARAEGLRPLLRREALQIERTRRLRTEVLAAPHRMQAFNLQLTAAYGGPEVDPLTHLRVIEDTRHPENESSTGQRYWTDSQAR